MRRSVLVLTLALGFGLGTALHAQETGSTNDRFQTLMGLARVKRTAGDVAAARRYFEEARRLRPFDQKQLTEYFWVLAGHDSAAALSAGREVLAGTPDARDVRDRMITEAIAVSDESIVRSLAAEGARRQPGTSLWPRRIGESHLRQGQPQEAAEAFARAIRAQDATVDDRGGFAVSLEGAKRYAESVTAWREVPAAARAARTDWEMSRLRAFAHGAPAADAATELRGWLNAHADDEVVRELLVTVWMRADQPKEALAVLTPAPAGATGERWIRRRMAIAAASNLPVAGTAAVDELIARGTATSEDRRTQAGWLIDAREYEKAATAVRSLAPKSGRCDARLLTIADRLPDPSGTDLLTDLLTRPDCKAPASWIRRGAERHVAVSNHQAALALLKTLPAAELEQPEMVRLAGQVHVWTGDVPEGIRLLERAVKLAPQDQAAQQTLHEARRALYRVNVIEGTTLRGPETVTLSYQRPADRIEPPTEPAIPALPRNAAELDLKRRAEELSWSGRHIEAVRAYDLYLAAVPGDLESSRQQARVAGWGGQYGLSRRLYAQLQARMPGHAGIAAEAAAKSAFYAGRWRASAKAYEHWIQLEPEASEARFEYAESLRADGRVAEADAALEALMASAPHDQGRAAWNRARDNRRPSVALITNGKSADGYEGQRLLDLGEYGGALRMAFGSAGTTALSIQGSRVRASDSSTTRNGYAAGLTSASTLSKAFALDGRVTVWDLATSGDGTVEAMARANWRPLDRWTIAVGASQEALFENMTTVSRGLTALGGFAGVTFDSTRTWLSVQVAQQQVSDDNDRTRATLTVSRALSDRLRAVRVVGWAESLRYRSASPDYFSPSHQLRADIGLEYTHTFRAAQFRGDRQQTLTAGYLIGTDNDGVTYHHPLVRLSFEIVPGLALDGHANWIRSDVYRETSAFVGLRVTGQAFGR